MITLPPPPPPLVAQGQAETRELARLRALRALLMPLGARVDSTFYENMGEGKIQEAHLVQVNVNSIQGIRFRNESVSSNTWTVQVELNLEEAIESVQKDLSIHTEALHRLTILESNSFRKQALERVHEQIQQDIEILSMLKSRASFR